MNIADTCTIESPLLRINRTPPADCSICGSDQLGYLGSKDFGRCGNDHFCGERQFADYGVSIPYYRCSKCGLVFTNAMDSWTTSDFKLHIYNADYRLADPPFEGERAARNSALIAALWHRQKETIRLLDYGGGCGDMARRLRALGINASSCDPFFGSAPAGNSVDVLTCFEVLEHIPHRFQKVWFSTLVAHMGPDSTLLLSTEIFGESISIDHWYLCPRNGHITVHSANSLKQLAVGCDLEVFSVNSEMHLMRKRARESTSIQDY